MKLHLFIKGEGDYVYIEKEYTIKNDMAPDINLQDLVDDAVKYEQDRETLIEAQRLTYERD